MLIYSSRFKREKGKGRVRERDRERIVPVEAMINWNANRRLHKDDSGLPTACGRRRPDAPKAEFLRRLLSHLTRSLTKVKDELGPT